MTRRYLGAGIAALMAATPVQAQVITPQNQTLIPSYNTPLPPVETIPSNLHEDLQYLRPPNQFACLHDLHEQRKNISTNWTDAQKEERGKAMGDNLVGHSDHLRCMYVGNPFHSVGYNFQTTGKNTDVSQIVGSHLIIKQNAGVQIERNAMGWDTSFISAGVDGDNVVIEGFGYDLTARGGHGNQQWNMNNPYHKKIIKIDEPSEPDIKAFINTLKATIDAFGTEGPPL